MALRNYETVFILTPVMSEEEVRTSVDKFKKILTDNGAEIIHLDNWGLRKFAYPIDKKNSGFYTVVEFLAKPESIKTLETEYKRDERVLRHIVIALDKHAVVYNEKKRNKIKQQNEAQ
ncbi:MAG: 30S ribosomal protein S6 [Cytophagia bacterium]|nr:MAG: 30S ribosomal protein S6 [Cytophagales bacterium]TAG00651.1 MAG: 30S ribosomal protein S6 [Cytophagia bacterium]TAG41734.1 MAG: 30S ribosomal protein S6 [Cytophagia bacterium]TAH27900.1 MAG: 30S ribosomal protein S6 [Cytophagales bacterium]